MSQSLINQGNILTEGINYYWEDYHPEMSQSLINQGNILTKKKKQKQPKKYVPVAIPYKSGKYSYEELKENAISGLHDASQSLINQGNILTALKLSTKTMFQQCRNPL